MRRMHVMGAFLYIALERDSLVYESLIKQNGNNNLALKLILSNQIEIRSRKLIALSHLLPSFFAYR